MLSSRTFAALMLIALGLAAGSCGDDTGDESSVDWITPWARTDGTPVPTATVFSFAGPEHCSWEETLWISFDGELYIRDPEQLIYGMGEFRSWDGTPQDPTADDLYQALDGLPSGARDTGLRLGDSELWVNPAEEGDAIYLVSGDLIERLPRTLLKCA